MLQSLPAWGAWVEISRNALRNSGIVSRSPHGERGLKCIICRKQKQDDKSLPAWGAWVEIIHV